jgi:hypothetical protein
MAASHCLLVRSDDVPGEGEDVFQRSELPSASAGDTLEDLTVNGDLDQQPFYWRFPNHWIAGSWFEWFSTCLRIPEFTDGNERGFVHTRPSSQRLQLWGGSYAGGLMQSVTVTPCAYYQFHAFGQSRPGSEDPPPVDVASHMKVGVEPHGWMSGRSISGYNPGLEPNQFPDTVVWSPEATHNFAFAPYSVTVEALSDTVTLILYSNPEVDIKRGVWWNDTLWDTASLIEVQPPSGTILTSTAILPEPDGLITNLSILAYPHQAIIEWETTSPASTQVAYRITEPAPPVSGTTLLFYSVYLPFVVNDYLALDQYSPLDSTPALYHQVILEDLPFEYTIEFVALSARLDGQACVTSVSSLTHMVSRDETRVGDE